MQTTEIPHKNKMIKYNLKCKNKHEFESWFFDSNEFEKLKKKKLLECIFCKSKNVKKSIMSPKIINLSRKIKANKESNIEYQKAKEELIKIRKYVEKNFQFVGDNFADKVRDIYYDKLNNNKNIYGTITKEENKELNEEGIFTASIPWIDKDN